MFCPSCGNKIESNTEVCLSCGTNVKTYQASTAVNSVQTVDKPNTLVNILSLCCFPILGIVLYFVWKNEKPAAAKSALTFALIGLGLSVVAGILSFALGVSSSY